MKSLHIPSVNVLFVSVLLTLCVTFGTTCMAQNERAHNLDSAVEELKKSAGIGAVRVILKIKMTAQDKVDSTLESQKKADIINLAKKSGVTVFESIKGQPIVVMELNADQIDTLAKSGLVEMMYEDRIDRAF